MRIEHSSEHDGLPTIIYIINFEEIPAITVAQRGCSISWFIDSTHEFKHEDIRQPLAAIVALHPILVHVFGRAAERVHDELDRELHVANRFALTIWSAAYTADEAVFEIFRVDFPAEETADRWSSRVVIVDERLPAAEREALLEKLRDPDESIREYLARA